jgi:hypothetical protein
MGRFTSLGADTRRFEDSLCKMQIVCDFASSGTVLRILCTERSLGSRTFDYRRRLVEASVLCCNDILANVSTRGHSDRRQNIMDCNMQVPLWLTTQASSFCGCSSWTDSQFYATTPKSSIKLLFLCGLLRHAIHSTGLRLQKSCECPVSAVGLLQSPPHEPE